MRLLIVQDSTCTRLQLRTWSDAQVDASGAGFIRVTILAFKGIKHNKNVETYSCIGVVVTKIISLNPKPYGRAHPLTPNPLP